MSIPTAGMSMWLVFVTVLLGQMTELRARQTTEQPASPAEASSPATPSPNTASPGEKSPDSITVPEVEGVAKPSRSLSDIPTTFPSIQYLKNRAGELVPVLKGVEFEGYLKYLEALRSPSSKVVEDWSIGRLSLEGTARGEFAELTTNIEVEILNGEKTVIVPLQMGEATLREESHTGVGQCGMSGSDPERGQIWWFRGAGKYQLKLTLLVPLFIQERPVRRLKLTLPPSTVSDLKLRVPFPRVRPSTEEKTTRIRVASIEGESSIELLGLGTKIDFTWLPLAGQSEINPTFHSRTAMNVLLDGQSVLVEANQRIEPLQGEFSEVTVRIPVGMELVKLESTRYKEHRIESQDQSRVRILLDQDDRNGSTPIDLKWLLRSRLPPDRTQVQLGGFEVDQGRIQTGIAVIRVSGAYRVQRLEPQDVNIVRESLSGLDRMTSPPLPGVGDPSNIVGVYRILSQPFQMIFDLKKIDAYVSSEQPLYVTHYSGNSLEMEATYVLQVARGSVDNFVLDWPNWKGAGWSIESCRAQHIADPGEHLKDAEYEITLDSTEQDSVEVQPAEPVSGHIQIRLNARRPLAPGSQATQIQFPLLRSTSSENGVLITTLADNLDFDSKPAGSTTIRPLDPPALNSELLERNADRRRMAYLLNNYQTGLSVRTTVKPPTLTVESLTTASCTESGLDIEQLLSYSVSYQRMSQLVVWVPTSWIESLEFRLNSGEELPTILTQSTEPGFQQVRIPLEKSLSGNFQLRIQAHVSSSELNFGDELQISFVRPAEERLSRSRLRTRNQGGIEVGVIDDRWIQEPGEEMGAMWASPSVASQVICKLNQFSDKAPAGLVVSKGWIQTISNGAGEEHNVARISLPGIRDRIRFGLPEECELVGVRLDDVEIQATPVSGKRNLFDLSISKSLLSRKIGTPVLECEYTSHRLRSNSGFHPVDLQLVDFGVGATWREVVWELFLPADEYLFRSPGQFNPLYRWQRQGFLYSRLNTLTADGLAEWMGVKSKLRPDFETTAWNRYVMSRFGGGPSVRIVTLRRHLIFALGSGIAFGVTVLLLSWPLMRNVLVFWGIGMILAVVGVWYPEPLFLFLQPGLVGFCLGLVSCIVQVWRQNQSGPSGKWNLVPGKRSFSSAPAFVVRPTPGSSVEASTSLRGGAPLGHGGLPS